MSLLKVPIASVFFLNTKFLWMPLQQDCAPSWQWCRARLQYSCFKQLTHHLSRLSTVCSRLVGYPYDVMHHDPSSVSCGCSQYLLHRHSLIYQFQQTVWGYFQKTAETAIQRKLLAIKHKSLENFFPEADISPPSHGGFFSWGFLVPMRSNAVPLHLHNENHFPCLLHHFLIRWQNRLNSRFVNFGII
jgi:hypothetical protein